MLRIFKLDNSRLTSINPTDSANLFSAIWIDLVSPQDGELELIHNNLGQPLVKPPEVLDDIAFSARCFEDFDGLHINSLFFYTKKSAMFNQSGNSNVAFTIRDGRLYTLRNRELPAFSLYTIRARNKQMVNVNPFEVLLDLFETKIEQLTDEIENTYCVLERVATVIMKGTICEKYYTWLSHLSEIEDIGWKVRFCLMDTQRALNFLIRKKKLQYNELMQAKKILRDITSLLPHNESVFQRVNFLIQAAMGFINIEQNRIIKIFSVVSVVFLPPTLLASIYGMNFEVMPPELSWKYGYIAAIGLMILVGLAPYLYFKRKKWL